MIIYIYDTDGKIIESYADNQALYDSLTRRYVQLKNKRAQDISKSFYQGVVFGLAIAGIIWALFTIIKSVL